MEMMIDIQKINILLNDIWSFQLILFGLAVTLFTVIYSFVINKRDELRSIANSIKDGDQTPILLQRQTFAKKYIVRLKNINNRLAILIILTFLIAFFGWISERFISDFKIELKKYIVYTLATITGFILIYVSIQSYKIFEHYKESTKI